MATPMHAAVVMIIMYSIVPLADGGRMMIIRHQY